MYAFEYHRPASIKQAAALARKLADSRLIAGGQSLIPALKLRLSRAAAIIDLGELPELEFKRYPWLRPEAALLKPFTLVDLLSTVKRVLAEAKNKSAYFQSLNDVTQQLSFPWESLLPTEATSRNNRGRSSA